MSRSFVAASSQYLAFTAGQPVTTYPCTFSCWFKPNASANGALMEVSHGSDNNRIALYANSSGKVAMVSSTAGTAAEAVSSTTYTAGAWNHALGTVGSATARTVLLNGGGSASNSTSIATANCAKYYIGALWANGALTAGYYFDGEIADAAVWNVVLTADEQAALAAGVSPLLVRPESLMCYHPLLARSTVEEDWISIFPLTNTGTTAGTSRPRISYPQAQFAQAASVAATPDTITISTPSDGRIHQRSGSTGTITVTGTYTGAAGPTTIEARLVQDGTSTEVGGTWTTKVASPAGGTYSFNFTGVAENQWLNVQVRWSNNTAINATSGKVGVGALVGVVGQSSAYLWFRSRTTATTPNSKVGVYGNIGTWAAPDNSAMAGAIGFGNYLATTLNTLVGVLDYAYDASGLYAGGSAQWLPVGGTVNRIFTDGVGALDDKLEAIVWVQGEADAGSGVSQANYYNSLGTLFADWRSAFSQASLPIVIATLAKRTVAGYTDAQHMAIYDAQVQKCGDSNIYRVDRKDLPMDADGVHHNPAGYEALGARCARAVAYAVGAVATYRGPRIVQVRKVDATRFDCWLTHDMGSDISPPSGITGFRVLDGGSPIAVSDAIRRSATKIRLTLASAPAALPVVQYVYGNIPTVTSVVLDNGTLTLPLEGTSSSGVTAQNANTATVTLVNESNAAQSSLSSLKWAWFDEVRPDLFVAPTDQGSAETTDGSGVLTVDLPNSSRGSGQVGWLVVTNSDGTTTQSPAHRAFSGPVAVN